LLGTAGAWDWVNGSNASVYFDSAQSNVNGGGNGIYLTGSGTAVGIEGTSSSADSVVGSGAQVIFSGASASVSGNSDTLTFNGGVNTAKVSGGSETLEFASVFGVDNISGLQASDSFRFADFGSWATLQNHMHVTNGNTVVTLDPNNSVTLVGVTLGASQVSFF